MADSSLKKDEEEVVVIFVKWKTVGGKRIYASSYGLKAFRLEIPRSKYRGQCKLTSDSGWLPESLVFFQLYIDQKLSDGGLNMKQESSSQLTEDLKLLLRIPPRVPSEAISIVAERYAAILAPERKHISRIFTDSEMRAIQQACKDMKWSPWSIIGGVLATIRITSNEMLYAFNVDRAALESKLSGLSHVQQFALIEMIEEFWENN